MTCRETAVSEVPLSGIEKFPALCCVENRDENPCAETTNCMARAAARIHSTAKSLPAWLRPILLPFMSIEDIVLPVGVQFSPQVAELRADSAHKPA
jgi:hypothetical protein